MIRGQFYSWYERNLKITKNVPERKKDCPSGEQRKTTLVTSTINAQHKTQTMEGRKERREKRKKFTLRSKRRKQKRRTQDLFPRFHSQCRARWQKNEEVRKVVASIAIFHSKLINTHINRGRRLLTRRPSYWGTIGMQLDGASHSQNCHRPGTTTKEKVKRSRFASNIPMACNNPGEKTKAKGKEVFWDCITQNNWNLINLSYLDSSSRGLIKFV
ncbi:hypothetical protein CHS0354_013439 [Potamilus streckersoni]|uniref:Uncharacterized protein n=1 Tax=Potamilus streckersoni TaxID=2493646 RepID=A0AAE0RYS2_9BIVA|nr:hypothetical protein CHS0354_013439 [Potamilus streckersoni]